jgi:hypothetical protein
MFIKPIFKTLLLSGLIFILLVALGMKYHWVAFFQSPESEVELSLPQRSIPLITKEKDMVSKLPFQLEIIHSTKQPITANMSKQQILEGCLQLYNKLGVSNEAMIDVITGVCVVSNYQETIQNTVTQQRSSGQIQQKQLIEKSCYQQVEHETQLTPLEKQLLWGVCVSDGLNH